MSIKLRTASYEELIDNAKKCNKTIIVSVIDPGTSMGLVCFELDAAGNSKTLCAKTIEGAKFISTAKGSEVESAWYTRMSGIISSLKDNEFFIKSDFYILEQQFEQNVLLSLGAICGAISALRMKEVQISKPTKSNHPKISSHPWTIRTIEPKSKATLFVKSLMSQDQSEPEKKQKKQKKSKLSYVETKQISIKSAQYIGKYFNDTVFLEACEENEPASDIADAYLYSLFLRNVKQN